MANIHDHIIRDGDQHFMIDPATRVITNTTANKTSLMQYDHNSERFSFEIPKIVEGHDMSISDSVQIHYLNTSDNRIDKKFGIYEVLTDDIAVIAGEGENATDRLVFSWLISDQATQYSGTLSFAVLFTCKNQNGDVTYRWSTAIHNAIVINPSMNNGKVMTQDYADMLNKWEKELAERIEGLGASIVDKGVEEINDRLTSEIDKVNAKVDGGIEEITELFTSASDEVNTKLDGKLDLIEPNSIETDFVMIVKDKNSYYQTQRMGTYTPKTSYTDFTPVLRGTQGQLKGQTPPLANQTDLDLINRGELTEKLGGKLDKETTVKQTKRLYGVRYNSLETQLFEIDNGNATDGKIPQYYTSTNPYITTSANGGVLVTSTPLQPVHAANKQYVDDLVDEINTTLDTKLEKYTTAGGERRLYGVDTLGNQYMAYVMEKSGQVMPGWVATYRSVNDTTTDVDETVNNPGRLITASPVYPSHAANKKYVDECIAAINFDVEGEINLGNYYRKDETYSKTEINTTLDSKLDKVTQAYKIYGTGGSGEQITRGTGWSEVSGNIPLYDDNHQLGGYNDDGSANNRSGALITAIPYKPKHATPKKWVEDLVSTATSKLSLLDDYTSCYNWMTSMDHGLDPTNPCPMGLVTDVLMGQHIITQPTIYGYTNHDNQNGLVSIMFRATVYSTDTESWVREYCPLTVDARIIWRGPILLQFPHFSVSVSLNDDLAIVDCELINSGWNHVTYAMAYDNTPEEHSTAAICIESAYGYACFGA